MKNTSKLRVQAFSLVELSIVLVILGLLTGGILGGQALMRAAELRNITTEHQKYTTAIMTFRDQYFALPGDMPNATAFWGVAHATPTTCATTASTGTETCNGNGDGRIVHSSTTSEYFRLWQHLANAGLIEGTYNGIAGSGGFYDVELGQNTPYSKVSEGGYFIKYSSGVDSTQWFNGTYGNYISFGKDFPSNMTYDKILRVEEAWNIDVKIDDGRPATGMLFAGQLSSCTNASGQADTTADYDLQNSAIACSLIFLNQF